MTKMEPDPTPPTRFSQLPADLTYLLALDLPWRDLYTAYISLPDYRRYDEQDGRLWRELYERDISTYPLPDDSHYREQYFWARDMIDALHGKDLELQVYLLTRLGYDKALETLLKDIKPSERPVWEESFIEAGDRGYLSILELLDPERNVDLDARDQTLLNAANNGHLDVVRYMLRKYSNIHIDTVADVTLMAAAHGRRDVVHLLMDAIREFGTYMPITHQQLFEAAVQGDNIELVEEFITDGLNLTQLFPRHLNVLLYLRERLNLPDDPQTTMAAAARDCELDYLKYLYDQDAVIDTVVMTAAIEDCQDPAVHDWLLQFLIPSDIPPKLPLLIHHQTWPMVRKYLDVMGAVAFSQTLSHDILEALDETMMDDPEKILEHPHLRLPNRHIVSFFQQGHQDYRLVMTPLLLNRLNSTQQIDAVARQSLDFYRYLLQHYRYTPNELARMHLNNLTRRGPDLAAIRDLIVDHTPRNDRRQVAKRLTQTATSGILAWNGYQYYLDHLV